MRRRRSLRAERRAHPLGVGRLAENREVEGRQRLRRIASRSTSRMTFHTLPSFSDPVVTPMTAW